MHDRFSDWKSRLVSLGIFILFVVEFGEFVIERVWHAIAPLFNR
jgi:hypothetical protein